MISVVTETRGGGHTVGLAGYLRQAELRNRHVSHVFEVKGHSVVRTRASKGRFPRGDAIWLCDGSVGDFLGHLQGNLEGAWRARVTCEDSLILVAALGCQHYLQALLLSVKPSPAVIAGHTTEPPRRKRSLS